MFGPAASMCPEAPRPLLRSWGLDKAPPGNQAVRVLLTLSAQSLLSDASRTSYLALVVVTQEPPSSLSPPSRS